MEFCAIDLKILDQSCLLEKQKKSFFFSKNKKTKSKIEIKEKTIEKRNCCEIRFLIFVDSSGVVVSI